ncbi:MAG: hypothetical protein VX966_04045 [Chloroflexota bacterium]|nr:hypothetical protein [Chloroflexota bacterium]
MTKDPQTQPRGPAQELTTCYTCKRPLPLDKGHVFKSGDANTGILIKCRVCALIHIPMIKKSGITATVVGVILTGLNQGDVILSGPISASLLWKIPLTFLVPFCVATFSALANTRR